MFEDINTENIYTNMLICLNLEHADGEIIKLHQDQNKHFIIKRHSCHEAAEHWLISARSAGTCQELREGKNRHIGIVTHEPMGCKKSGMVFVVFEVIERTLKANGQEFLEPEIEVNTWWTNLAEKPEMVIHLYHKHNVIGRR